MSGDEASPLSTTNMYKHIKLTINEKTVEVNLKSKKLHIVLNKIQP